MSNENVEIEMYESVEKFDLSKFKKVAELTTEKRFVSVLNIKKKNIVICNGEFHFCLQSTNSVFPYESCNKQTQ